MDNHITLTEFVQQERGR